MTHSSSSARASRILRVVSLTALLGAFASACSEQAPSTPRGGSGGAGRGGGTAAGGSGGNGGTPSAGGSGQVAGGTAGSGGAPAPPACPGEARDAYQGTPAAIPGTAEAENFDPAGYSDTTTGNEGGVYRTDVDADIKELGAGYALGWMTAGEWLEYTVDVTLEGDYRIVLRAGAVDAGRTLEISQCETPIASSIAVPQVADWGEVGTVIAGPVHLAAGVQVMRLTVGDSDYLDLDSISFEPVTDGTGGSGGTGGTGGGGGSGPGTVEKFVGNITTGWSGALDTNGRVFSTYWDQVTPENAGKWGSVQSSASSGFDWDTLDAIYDYAEQKGILFKQHAFVWGSQQPSGNLSEAQVKTWIQTFCERYPNTRLIDVVNEPPPHTEPSYADAIGGGTNGDWQWITNAFKWAREYCPDAILILNDYNNIEYADQNQHFIDIAKTIQAAGAPIDAVGAQAHGLSGGISTATMKSLVTKMHEDTGLPVYITEYDIDLADDAAQLAKYQEHLPFFLETEWIHGVTVWGWIHGSTWVPDSGLIRNGSPRPAMTWLMQELGRPAP